MILEASIPNWLNLKDLRYTLNRIKRLSQLEMSPYLKSNLVSFEIARRKLSDTPRDRALALKDLLERAIDELRPNESYSQNDPVWSDFNTLKFRYIESKTRQEVARTFNLGVRTYDRIHQQAIERLGRQLHSEEEFAQEEMKVRETIRVPHNLPRRIAFVSRPEYLQDRVLDALDERKRPWLVLLVGSGGMGKTALATEAAYQSLEKKWFDGAIWIDARTQKLTSRGIETMKAAILSIDDFYNEIGKVLNESAILKTDIIEEKSRLIHEILGRKKYLLVIDNYETLPIEAQQKLMEFLLSRSGLPDTCKIMITSRSRSNVDEGRTVDIEGMNRDQSLEFIRRKADDLNLKEVLEASENELDELRLATDGSPLAMEWIVGRMAGRAQTMADVIEDLESVDENVDLLEYCFRNLFGSLNSTAQLILCVIGYFPDSISRFSIVSITKIDPETVDEAIAELINVSLVKNTKANRFSVLQLTQDFLQVEIDRRKELFDREFMINAETYYLDYCKRNQSVPEKMQFELDNIVTILRWCLNTSRWQQFIAFVKLMTRFLFVSGYWSEYLRLTQAAIGASKASGDKKSDILLQTKHLAYLYFFQGNYDEAIDTLNRCLVSSRQISYKEGEAWALGRLGIMYREKKSLQQAKDFLETSQSLFQELGDTEALEEIQGSLASTLIDIGEYNSAENIYLSLLALAENRQDLLGISELKSRLGSLARDQEDYDLARKLILESLEIRKDFGYLTDVAYSYRKLAQIEFGLKNYDSALEYATKAREYFSDKAYSTEQLKRIEIVIEQIKKASAIGETNS